MPALQGNRSIAEHNLFLQRPFYIIGHNPNTIPEVRQALDAGANAIEPDVNVYSHNADELCISHFEGGREAPSLQEYLLDLHTVAKQYDRLSLVIFDCKTAVTTAKFGLSILHAIRNYLTFDIALNVIISVSGLEAGAIFDDLINNLGPREGLMIDENNDPELVSNYFRERNVTNQCYANGMSVPLKAIMGPNTRPSIERACALRVSTGVPKFICVWTINNEHLKREYMKIGVDGIISDDVKESSKLAAEPEFQPTIRMALRQDNPFSQEHTGYGLAVYTSDSPMAGTDANVTFILNGQNGSAQTKVNSEFRGRMERNQVNYVTLSSLDLGNLISISVQRDDDGNAPDWCLDRIVVTSTFFPDSKIALFNREINTISPFNQQFL